MKLEDMPVVTVEEVLRFRAEAIRQRDELERDYKRLLQGNAMTMEQAMSNGADAIALRQERDALSAVVERQREFLAQVAKQTPEKPDHWSSCGQCERNSSDAEDLIEITPSTALRLHDAEVLERAVIGIRRRAGQVDSDGRHLECAGLEDAATYIEHEIARLRAGGEG